MGSASPSDEHGYLIHSASRGWFWEIDSRSWRRLESPGSKDWAGVYTRAEALANLPTTPPPDYVEPKPVADTIAGAVLFPKQVHPTAEVITEGSDTDPIVVEFTLIGDTLTSWRIVRQEERTRSNGTYGIDIGPRVRSLQTPEARGGGRLFLRGRGRTYDIDFYILGPNTRADVEAWRSDIRAFNAKWRAERGDGTVEAEYVASHAGEYESDKERVPHKYISDGRGGVMYDDDAPGEPIPWHGTVYHKGTRFRPLNPTKPESVAGSGEPVNPYDRKEAYPWWHGFDLADMQWKGYHADQTASLREQVRKLEGERDGLQKTVDRMVLSTADLRDELKAARAEAVSLATKLAAAEKVCEAYGKWGNGGTSLGPVTGEYIKWSSLRTPASEGAKS